jgi:signal transduction histidine kinase
MELGIVLMKEGRLHEAGEKFNQAKTTFEKENSVQGIAQCFLYLAKIKSAEGTVTEAIALFEEGYRIATGAGDKSLQSVLLCNIAREKLESGNYTEAISLLQQAKTLALKTQEKPVQSQVAEQLSKGYVALGNVELAFDEYRNFISLRDEVNKVETSTLLRNLQISNRVEVLEKENRLLETEKLAAIAQLTTLVQTQEIKSLNAMMDGQERERRRIAADLHDRIGGSLAAIKLHLTSLVKSLDDNLRKTERVTRLNSMFDSVMQEVRQVSHDLASGVLIKFGLVSALRELAEGIQSAGNMGVNFYDAGFDERIDSRTEIALYRISQELITNVLKHAQATEMSIYLSRYEDHLSLIIEDDGRGFDPGNASGGIGTDNIRSRVNQLHGSVQYDSAPGRGCTVTIEIPNPQPK